MSNTVNSLDELIALIDEQQAERLILELDITRYNAEYAKALKRLTEAEAMQGRQLALDNAFISSKSEDIDYLRDQVEKLRPQSVKTVYVAFKRLSARERSALDKRINAQKLTALQQYEKALPNMFLGIYSTPEADDDHLISADYKLISSTSDKTLLTGRYTSTVPTEVFQWQDGASGVRIPPEASVQDLP